MLMFLWKYNLRGLGSRNSDYKNHFLLVTLNSNAVFSCPHTYPEAVTYSLIGFPFRKGSCSLPSKLFSRYVFKYTCIIYQFVLFINIIEK